VSSDALRYSLKMGILIHTKTSASFDFLVILSIEKMGICISKAYLTTHGNRFSDSTFLGRSVERAPLRVPVCLPHKVWEHSVPDLDDRCDIQQRILGDLLL
jgi:hypothetical protein